MPNSLNHFVTIQVQHGALVAAVVSERLEALGKAHITLAVRRKASLFGREKVVSPALEV